MKLALTITACALVGCATCERHPVICSIAGLVAAGAVATSIHQRKSCHPVPHGDVELPPSGGAKECR
jgi:hypothetical protein